MSALKYSRQRECIKEILMSRTDHPTADELYSSVRERYPNISLGTIYRNLSLLASLGEIQKLTTGNGADHFDGKVEPHYHFVCKECNCVQDIHMTILDSVNDRAAKYCDGTVDSHTTFFYGTCNQCKQKNQLKEDN